MPTHSTPFKTLISAAELAPHVADPDWLVVDCRFELGKPDTGERAYAAGHIPHAIYAHLDRDLAAPVTPATGRHPLPQPETFAGTLTRWGMTPATQVVAYDADNAAYAARLWWLLRWVGHEAVAVLDGGFKAWTAAGLPTTTEVPRRRAGHFAARPNRDMWYDASEVARARSARRLAPARRARAGALRRHASSRSIRSPVTCRARAIIRSRPISAATDASLPRTNCEIVSSSRRPASPTITRLSCAAPA